MSTRRRRVDRLEQNHVAASLERMTIDELIDELVQIEMNSEAPLLTFLLPAAGPPRGMTPVEHLTALDRAFRERDEEALRQHIASVFQYGDWGAVCSALETAMRVTEEATWSVTIANINQYG